ncbi:uncharacterized protein LOC129950400 [Eupeodes corollae]|uniref:uncharacterized protein LOC129950400 n=1 Tax=Eupeodes corollae TaxID=290404 RepID=UPI002491FB5F|nr:uncharacterized protein LOC129950400 [Eupeodes corollae]
MSFCPWRCCGKTSVSISEPEDENGTTTRVVRKTTRNGETVITTTTTYTNHHITSSGGGQIDMESSKFLRNGPEQLEQSQFNRIIREPKSNSISTPSTGQKFEMECLNEHNRLRALHGCPPLKLSPKLSAIAKKWAINMANSNNLKHSNSNYGENLYMCSGYFIDGSKAVESWYNEIKQYSFRKPVFNSKTGHFTQVIWKDSKELGVGVEIRGNSTWVVANYDPPGNVVGYFEQNVPKLLRPLSDVDADMLINFFEQQPTMFREICCGCVIDGKGRIGLVPKQKGIALELQTRPPSTEQPKRMGMDTREVENLKTNKKISISIPRLKKPAKELQNISFTTNPSDFTTPSLQNTHLPKTGHINPAFSISSEAIHNTSNTRSKSIACPEASTVRDSSNLTNSKFPTVVPGDTNPIVKSTSNFTYVSKKGERHQMSFEQIAPGHFHGVFKNHQFIILKGELLSTDGAFDESDKDLIVRNYLQAILAMQQGLSGLEERILNSLNQKLPSINPRKLSELTIPNESKIKVNYRAENGEKSHMTFRQIKPGLFRGTCNNKAFAIANGQVLPLRRSDRYGLDKELILSTFLRAMMGMQQTELGLQRGEWAIETKLSGNQLNPMELLKAACPDRRLLFETESLSIHNEYRRIHGVPPLAHSELLCRMAREWAEHLALKDTTRKRPDDGYGENLYHSHHHDEVSLDARKIISTWYNEINSYDFKNPRFTNETEHFTQLVWKDTKEMGTGIAQLGDKIWVCCYYHPPGNGLSKPFEEFVLKPVEVSRT